MRIFTAVEFDGKIKEYLKEVQGEIEKFSRRGNFTDENNFHLTVKFIGEVSRGDLDNIIEGVNAAAERSRRFSLRLSRLGFFPRGNRTIVWAGVERSAGLLKLFDNVERELLKEGFPKEKRGISPHITLGREVDLTEKFDNMKAKIPLEPLEISANKISVMESKRIDGKLVYKAVFVQNLK